MNTIARTPPVVVGVDGSTEGIAALRYAIRLAATLHTELEAIHCSAPERISDVVFATPLERERRSMCLVQVCVAEAVRGMPASSRPDVRITELSVPGHAASILLRRSERAAAMVLGTHRQTTMRDLVMGQVVRTVLRHARCPVTVVNADGEVVRTTGAQAVTIDRLVAG